MMNDKSMSVDKSQFQSDCDLSNSVSDSCDMFDMSPTLSGARSDGSSAVFDEISIMDSLDEDSLFLPVDDSISMVKHLPPVHCNQSMGDIMELLASCERPSETTKFGSTDMDLRGVLFSPIPTAEFPSNMLFVQHPHQGVLSSFLDTSPVQHEAPVKCCMPVTPPPAGVAETSGAKRDFVQGSEYPAMSGNVTFSEGAMDADTPSDAAPRVSQQQQQQQRSSTKDSHSPGGHAPAQRRRPIKSEPSSDRSSEYSSGRKSRGEKRRPDTIAGVEASMVDCTRVWKKVSQHGHQAGESCEMNVTVKTRLDQPSELLPDRLYCSLKYEMQVTVPQHLVHDSVHFLHCKVVLVDSETMEDVTETDALEGTAEAALTRIVILPSSHDSSSGAAVLRGKLKVKINNQLSYHRTSRENRFEVRLFLPTDLEQAILIKQSPPFKVYARRPNKIRNHAKKRKATDVWHEFASNKDSDSDTIQLKQQRLSSVTSNGSSRSSSSVIEDVLSQVAPSPMELFTRQLEALRETMSKLDVQERMIAEQMLFSHSNIFSHPYDQESFHGNDDSSGPTFGNFPF